VPAVTTAQRWLQAADARLAVTDRGINRYSREQRVNIHANTTSGIL
jgi:hypothetical protein